jgi:hypothetical protein
MPIRLTRIFGRLGSEAETAHISPLLQATLIRACTRHIPILQTRLNAVWLHCRFHDSHNKNVKCTKKPICSVMEPLSAESEAVSMHLSPLV